MTYLEGQKLIFWAQKRDFWKVLTKNSESAPFFTSICTKPNFLKHFKFEKRFLGLENDLDLHQKQTPYHDF